MRSHALLAVLLDQVIARLTPGFLALPLPAAEYDRQELQTPPNPGGRMVRNYLLVVRGAMTQKWKPLRSTTRSVRYYTAIE
jgi:hypothetical protein